MTGSPMTTAALETLGSYLRGNQLLSSISSCLHWDQNTTMPAAGAHWRGEQLALLAQQLHARQTSPHYAQMLADAAASLPQLADGCGALWARNILLLRQDFERQRRLDPQLVDALAAAQARGYSLWQEARRTSSFSLFAPALTELVQLRLEQARQLDEARAPWETLAQPFEPDICHQRLAELFAPLRQRLPQLLDQLCSATQPATDGWRLSRTAQGSLCRQWLNHLGFDGSRCAVSRSPHPFSTALGPRDYRITSRFLDDQPLSAFLATAHEWGHSLYDQGLPGEQSPWYGWPTADATSMAVHESQALFWENRVVRDRSFCHAWAPRFAQAADAAPWGDGDGLWRAMNPLTPGLIRTEANEFTYCLHVLLRYELEVALLEGGLPVEALPERWNQLMKQYLGITPANDAEGCLQDVHWSEGLFGYFPSYALGHLVSAQLSETMEGAIGPIAQHVAAGEEVQLLAWLRKHVHPLGRTVNEEGLVMKVSKRPLTTQPFLDYLETKLSRLLASA